MSECSQALLHLLVVFHLIAGKGLTLVPQSEALAAVVRRQAEVLAWRQRRAEQKRREQEEQQQQQQQGAATQGPAHAAEVREGVMGQGRVPGGTVRVTSVDPDQPRPYVVGVRLEARCVTVRVFVTTCVLPCVAGVAPYVVGAWLLSWWFLCVGGDEGTRWCLLTGAGGCASWPLCPLALSSRKQPMLLCANRLGTVY